jgi:cytosine/adenosine deaminase-related metal-dependent hydrolase
MPRTVTGLVFDGAAILPNHAVDLSDDDVIIAIRRREDTDPEPLRGVIVPGLVNAHLHLELSHVGLIPGGEGLIRWVGRFLAARTRAEDDPQAAMRKAADAMLAAGTALVSDISNTRDAAIPLAAAGLSGVVHWELLGLDAKRLADLLGQADLPDTTHRGERGRIVVRPSPHALYSTAPALIRACVLRNAKPGRAPASIHLAEDRDELRFVLDGSGPWASFLDKLNVDWRWWEAPGTSPVEFLDALGVLGPDLIGVHGVHLTPRDRSTLARAKAPIVLCPRSNLHISGELPDVTALLEAGVPLALGTDSLASSPDLDVLAEIPVLASRFPSVGVDTWLRLATSAGADVLRMPGFGTLTPGRAPGVLLLDVGHPGELRSRVPARRWLAKPRWTEVTA